MVLKIFRVTACLLLVGWMAFIFFMSAQTAPESAKTSNSFVERVLMTVNPHFPEKPEAEQRETIEALQHVARKTAHFTIYAILGFISFLAFVTYRGLRMKLRVAIGLGVCLLYSASDEFHQTFVPGRSGELRDVCIDFCGAALAIIISLLISRFSKRIYKKVRWSGNA